MLSIFSGGGERRPFTLPLFPLRTVLFPGGLLPLKVFEQRYIDMTKDCLKEEQLFGVCLITKGEEVASSSSGPPEFARVRALVRLVDWVIPQRGVGHDASIGGTGSQV